MGVRPPLRGSSIDEFLDKDKDMEVRCAFSRPAEGFLLIRSLSLERPGRGTSAA